MDSADSSPLQPARNPPPKTCGVCAHLGKHHDWCKVFVKQIRPFLSAEHCRGFAWKEAPCSVSSHA